MRTPLTLRNGIRSDGRQIATAHLRRTSTLAAAILLVLLIGSSANAGLILALSDGTSHVVVVDQGGVGAVSSDGKTSNFADLDPTPGAVAFSGPVGTFTAVSVGLSKPLLGPTPQVDLFTGTFSGGAGTLLIAATDDQFDAIDPAPGEILSFGGTTAGSVSFWSYVDPDDMEFATNDGRLSGILDGAGLSIEMGNGNEQSVQSGPLGPGAFSDAILQGFSPQIPAPYSITLVAEVNHSAAFQFTSFDAVQTIVPEPGSMLIWGIFGLGVVGCARRRRNAFGRKASVR